ncbi:MAG: hypothetical protein ACF8LK_00270 [Phycisphaerales bacterium JB041]
MRVLLAALASVPRSAAPPRFPVGDWQFWIVTTVAIVAAVWLLRRLLPRRLLGGRRTRGKPATLTIGGRAVAGASKRSDCHEA